MGKSNLCVVLGVSSDGRYFVIYNDSGKVVFERVEKSEIGYITGIYTRYSEYHMNLREFSINSLTSFREKSLKFLESLKEDMYVYEGGGVVYTYEPVDDVYMSVDVEMKGYSKPLDKTDVQCIIPFNIKLPIDNILHFSRKANIPVCWDGLIAKDCRSCVFNKDGVCQNEDSTVMDDGCTGYDIDTEAEKRLLIDGFIINS